MQRIKQTVSLLTKGYSTVARKTGWESVVGLEIHAQIQAATKLFSPCGANFGAPVNNLVSLFDASIPGTLPVLNRRCVEVAVCTALALSCKLNMLSNFDRKHYFYADLPAGYQITQQRKAIAENGQLKFLVISPGGSVEPYYKTCRIHQLQLEQDSGKSLHDHESDRSLIDLNRAGIALMEIVFQPDLQNGEEAASLVKELILLFHALNACSCRMEEGALRVDANVSVNKTGESLGVRTEVKNLSSLRSLAYAIEYEVARQIAVKEAGGVITNETRSYDSELKETLPMRDKEVHQDYRFMPEPNLPPLRLCDDPTGATGIDSLANLVNIANIKMNLVDLPETVRNRLMNDFNLRIEAAHSIVHTPGLVSFFLSTMKDLPKEHGTRAANMLMTEVMEVLKKRDLTFEECPVTPKALSEVISLVETRQINIATAKDVISLLFNGEHSSATQIVTTKGWMTVTNHDLIRNVCSQILKDNPKLANDYRMKGKTKHFNKLVALAKNNVDGKVDVKIVVQTLERMLKE